MREILRVVEAEEDAEWVPEVGEVMSAWHPEESGAGDVVVVLVVAATDPIKREETVWVL